MDKRTLAVEHVLAQGIPALKWRAMRLAGREASLPPTEETVQQNADGGARCPLFDTSESSIGATSRMLYDLAFWVAGDTEACRRGIAFAWGHQQPDGRWTEAPIAGSSPPPWFMPGDLSVDLWMTANTAAALACLQPTTDVHDINWVLLRFYLGAIPKRHPTVSAYLDQLVVTQGEDGFWSTMYGEAREFFAMEALELLDAYRGMG